MRSIAFYLLLSLAWSWPLVRDPLTSAVSLHFDQYPAAWLVHAAPTFHGGVSALSGWPDGEPLVRLDSFLFLVLALLLQGMLPGLLVTNLFVLLGPVASAWAAGKLAKEVMGVGTVPALVAGAAFGFAPLATVGVLEGHVYYLLDPWLPLAVLHTFRNTRRDDVLAALFWTLSLLTTAYMGINATILVLAVCAWEERLPPVLLGLIGLAGAAYAGFFAWGSWQTGMTPAHDAHDALVRLGSASLTTLVAWAPWMDLNRHSLAPAIGVAPLCLALLSPFLPAPRWKLWLGLGLGAMVLSLGPVLEMGISRSEAWPTPLYPLLLAGAFDVYRFPIRFAWISALAFGLLAAAVAERVRRPPVLVAILVVDALLVSGGIFRVRGHPSPAPSLYRLLPEGPVLDLYPEVGGLQEDMGFYFQNLSCYYQLSHGHPIFDRCLNTNLSTSPRLAAARKLHAALLDGQDVRELVATLGATSVMVHAGLYQAEERALVLGGLTTSLGAPRGEGTDGGEWLVAFSAAAR